MNLLVDEKQTDGTIIIRRSIEVMLDRADLNRSQLAMMTLIIDASLEAIQRGWTHYSVWCDTEKPSERHGRLVQVHVQLTRN